MLGFPPPAMVSSVPLCATANLGYSTQKMQRRLTYVSLLLYFSETNERLVISTTDYMPLYGLVYVIIVMS